MGVLLVALLTNMMGAPGLEDWVRSRYLRHDPFRGWERTNRFRETSSARRQKLLEWSPGRNEYVTVAGARYRMRDGAQQPFSYPETLAASAREAISTLRGCQLPEGEGIYREVFVDEVVNTVRGAFISFFVDRVPGDESGSREYFWSVALSRNGECVALEEEPASIDAETGRYQREVWDFFDIDGVSYLLVWKRTYEAEYFEVFQLRERRLTLVESFLYWNADS